MANAACGHTNTSHACATGCLPHAGALISSINQAQQGCRVLLPRHTADSSSSSQREGRPASASPRGGER